MTGDKESMKRFRVNPEVEITKVDDDLFLVHLGTESIYHLDPVAAGIWRLLDGPMGTDEIVTVLASAFPDVPKAQLREDAGKVIGDLVKKSLLVEVK